jgi:hypothetical protein
MLTNSKIDEDFVHCINCRIYAHENRIPLDAMGACEKCMLEWGMPSHMVREMFASQMIYKQQDKGDETNDE